MVVYVKVLYLAIVMEKLKKTMKRLEKLVVRQSFEPDTSGMQASSARVAPFCLRNSMKESDFGVFEAISLLFLDVCFLLATFFACIG
jgi:hypothetical protein